MKIAIGVHGRFHAFGLARGLIERNNNVTLFTNYPAWAVGRWGINPSHVQSRTRHGIASRALSKFGGEYLDRRMHESFGRWLATRIPSEDFEVAHLWSGVALESLRALDGTRTLKLIVRGSAHIREQLRLLEEEEERVQASIDKPTRWIVGREEEEYQLADSIVVLSSFAKRSFLDKGISEDKLHILPLGANVNALRPDPQTVAARRARILAEKPLRILYVGALSARKGVHDLVEIVRTFPGRCSFRVVGPVLPEAGPYLERMSRADIIPKVPEAELPRHYAWADLFIFPTIEDGYAQVLSQAQASGLPLVATTNCAGPDLITEGSSGWVVPIRNPDAFVERLTWCDTHRLELAEMVSSLAATETTQRDWNDVATDFESIARRELGTEPERGGG
jgi:glycosyltransferase involved in cell wall biosynthesis